MGLTNKQRVFVEEYLKCWNATEAARRAGYAHPNPQGSQNLAKPSIAARVRERLEEHQMGADEVLYHLAQIARGDMDDLLTSSGLPDITAAREAGATGLIKRWKFRTVTTDDSDIHEVEVEPYDRLKALETLAKVHQLTTTSKVQIEDWRSQAIEDIRAGKIEYDALAEAFDDDLATELFRRAGVLVEVGED